MKIETHSEDTHTYLYVYIFVTGTDGELRDRYSERDERDERGSGQGSAHHAICLRLVWIWDGSICCDRMRKRLFCLNLRDSWFRMLEWCDPHPQRATWRSQTEAAQALGEGQLLNHWKKVKRALNEAKMTVRDRQFEKKCENAWESVSGGKGETLPNTSGAGSTTKKSGTRRKSDRDPSGNS